jgi:NAD(P)-dependent dehydrogenase (short-subunit alcohol dehydrogenase family)
MMIDLNGKIALVTGAGRGIGRAIAIELAGLGAHVALVSRSVDELDGVASEIKDRGGKALAVFGDLAELAEIDRVLGVVRMGLGDPDILINNAATVAPLGPTAQLDAADVTNALTLNVIAPVVLASGVIPAMIEHGWGLIVNVSSGIVARPASMIGGTVYAASKAALEAHTVNLAAELDGTGVMVNAYRPGTVDTEMHAWIRAQDPEKVGAQLHDRFTRAYTDGALISPEESARSLVARLDGSATGQVWGVSDTD